MTVNRCARSRRATRSHILCPHRMQAPLHNMEYDQYLYTITVLALLQTADRIVTLLLMRTVYSCCAACLHFYDDTSTAACTVQVTFFSFLHSYAIIIVIVANDTYLNNAQQPHHLSVHSSITRLTEVESLHDDITRCSYLMQHFPQKLILCRHFLKRCCVLYLTASLLDLPRCVCNVV
jgi:hypothetical protein